MNEYFRLEVQEKPEEMTCINPNVPIWIGNSAHKTLEAAQEEKRRRERCEFKCRIIQVCETIVEESE